MRGWVTAVVTDENSMRMPILRGVLGLGLLSLLLLACDESKSLTTQVGDSSIPDFQAVDVGAQIDAAPSTMSDASSADAGSSDATVSQTDATAMRDSTVFTDTGQVFDMEIENDAAISVDAAVETLDTSHSQPPNRAAQIAQILADLGLRDIRIRFPESDIEFQESTYLGTVEFTTALTEAINSFLTDGTDVESPRSLAADVRGGPCLEDDLTERVRCFLNRDTAFLELYGSEGFAPENREPIAENWIFVLRAESLSDHIQWAIIDRDGVEATYNYGFN